MVLSSPILRGSGHGCLPFRIFPHLPVPPFRPLRQVGGVARYLDVWFVFAPLPEIGGEDGFVLRLVVFVKLVEALPFTLADYCSPVPALLGGGATVSPRAKSPVREEPRPLDVVGGP